MTLIPRTDFDVFPLNLGTNPFGWTADRDESFAILDAFVEAGGNFVDSADIYSMWAEGNSGGESEEIIGQWLASRGADKLIVATKSGGHPSSEGRSREATYRAVDDSLRRLGLETIDIFYYHYDDENIPLAEQAATAESLIRDGRIRHLALSNYRPERMREFFEITQGSAAFPVAVQPQYNLLHRTDYEDSYRPLAEEFQAASFPYFALASGVLTGKYRSKADLEGRARQGFAEDLVTDDALRVVDALVEVAESADSAPTTVALAWLLTKGVTAPIASVSTPDQLPELMAAPELRLDDAAVARLDEASAPFAG
ncbi:aldo/keto reductase [Corynebacterium halotolerans]|uniref:NADP-dependent oxidoreductase domain-containing protein n=1 Tax=Corynebacterium halotolerans YIM 70093 = DSM 44683 TaxID=1121362 RepID=M1MX07_9CORY|nr:aldo/keto reductase [Corynebacterium halotolerans]AGF72289.1 hypothetical protein A605_06415 [Corynebacterium halotolerans YIM 70093 = DSM 44683]